MLRKQKRPALLIAAALMVTGLTTTPAAAAPDSPSSPRDFGNGAERNEVAATDPPANTRRAGPAGENKRGSRTGYPRQTDLRVYPEDPTDKSIKLGLTPYHSIAPMLNQLQDRSNRVSVEVVGQTGLGRDMYQVTVTAPERSPGGPPAGGMA